MRLMNVVLGLGTVALIASVMNAGCDDEQATTTTGADATIASVVSTAATGCTMTTATSTGSGDCPLDKSTCETDVSDCLSAIDNSKSDVASLRMSELHVTSPQALATGIVQGLVKTDSWPISGCQSTSTNAQVLKDTGAGLFDWLIQIDLKNKTLKTGGAKPVMDPTMGYAFTDEMLMGVQVSPATVDITTTDNPDGSIAIDVPMGTDITVPIYANAMATSAVLLPLHGTRLECVTLSKDHNCIGELNLAGLTKAGSCKFDTSLTATDTEPAAHAFVSGGRLVGYITLAEAQNVPIMMLGESLCSLLCGQKAGAKTCDPSCMGDWCSTTDMPADSKCHDAFQLTADFAASGVKINN